MFNDLDWPEIGQRITAAMAQKKLSAQAVADKAKCDRKTIDSARKGNPLRAHTLAQICKVLDIQIGAESVNAQHAPVELGGYSRAAYASYVGRYLMFRNSYDYADRLICSTFEIVWDEVEQALCFEESQRNRRQKDGRLFRYSFKGRVGIPPGLSITQFIGAHLPGFHRIITTTALRGYDEKAFFKGILVGINEISDIGFHPAATPVYIERLPPERAFEDLPPEWIGSHPREGFWHEEAVAALASVAQTFSAFRQV